MAVRSPPRARLIAGALTATNGTTTGIEDAPTDDGYIASATNLDDRSCALKNNGQVRCWGDYYNGVETVFTIDNPNNATLAMTEDEVCARTEQGTVTATSKLQPWKPPTWTFR